eukprot:s2110_g2.t1
MLLQSQNWVSATRYARERGAASEFLDMNPNRGGVSAPCGYRANVSTVVRAGELKRLQPRRALRAPKATPKAAESLDVKLRKEMWEMAEMEAGGF